MQAVATQPTYVDDNYWFPNSGETNNLTNNLSNLAISSKYIESGTVHMGNGTGLSVSHIGHNSFIPILEFYMLKTFFMSF